MFSVYCGLALHHAKLYDKIRRSEQKYKGNLNTLICITYNLVFQFIVFQNLLFDFLSCAGSSVLSQRIICQ